MKEKVLRCLISKIMRWKMSIEMMVVNIEHNDVKSWLVCWLAIF